MTLEELEVLLRRDVEQEGEDRMIHSEDARVVCGMRVSECRPLPGARIDIVCQVCDQRVALGPKAVSLIERGAAVACFWCVEAASGVPQENFPEGDRSLRRMRA